MEHGIRSRHGDTGIVAGFSAIVHAAIAAHGDSKVLLHDAVLHDLRDYQSQQADRIHVNDERQLGSTYAPAHNGAEG